MGLVVGVDHALIERFPVRLVARHREALTSLFPLSLTICWTETEYDPHVCYMNAVDSLKTC
jgi:hypothetical protein